MSERDDFAAHVVGEPGLLREIMAEPTEVTLELRPSQMRRVLAYQRRFVAALGEGSQDLADITVAECVTTLLDGALEADEHKHRLATDFLGKLQPYPLWKQTWDALLRAFSRVRRAIKRRLP